MTRRSTLALLVAAVAIALLLARSGDESPKPSGVDVVTKVTDGDTIWLGRLGKVRLIGIDTPEVFGHVDCYGPQASAFAKRTLQLGMTVRYEVGREAHDRYGRTLAYVWLPDGRMFNELLAADGYARPLTIKPNDEHAARFAAAARRAQTSGLGLWATCPRG